MVTEWTPEHERQLTMLEELLRPGRVHERKRIASIAAKLRLLAEADAFVMAVFQWVEEHQLRLRLTYPVEERRTAWREWADRRTWRLLSKLNRALSNDPIPPLDPGEAVAQALASIGGARVPWPVVREWLRSLWGWSSLKAERVMSYATIFSDVPKRQRLVRLISTIPFEVGNWPDSDWFLALTAKGRRTLV